MAAARVVLIEDHTMVRELFAHVLRENLAHQLVAECSTLADGAPTCLREKPDLVVLDWMLPDGRGCDLVRALSGQLPRTRWLMVSSHERGHLVREAVSLGVHGVVMKRSSLGVLRQAVTEVLAGRTYYCPESSRLLVERLVVEGGAGDSLTPREREVLRAFARGENPKALAERLGVSPKTVQNHISLLKEKLGLQEPAELVRYAIKHGYVENP